MKKILLLLVGLFLIASPQATLAGKNTKILNRGNGAEPKDVDPHKVTGVPEHHIIVALFEGLVSVDPKTAEPIPGVAELPPKMSPDGLVYTFTLRKNAKWSNGDPVTAHDFVYSWRRLVDPKTASRYADMAYPVKNAEAINKGKNKDLTKLGVKAVDNHTLQVTLENPTPYFLSMLYHYTMYPVHREIVKKFGPKWTRPENIVGNGPFLLKEWVLNKVIKTARNPHYWDAKNIKLDGVHFWAVENLSTEEQMFRAGKLHITNEVPPEKIPLWQRSGKTDYIQEPYLGTYYYRLNVTRKPLNDIRVRRALALAIDREKIVNFVTRGGQIPAAAYTPPGTGGYYPKKYLPTDASRVAEAKKLLVEAGFPGGKNFPTLEILYNTTEMHKKVAEAIQQMWKENLGINIKLFNQEWKVYLANMHNLNYDIARAGWIGDYNDPHTFLDMMVTGRGNNDTGWGNAEYDKLIQLAAGTKDPGKRKMIFSKAENILMTEFPVIPIYVYSRVYLKKENVKGWFGNVMDFHPLKFVDLK